ncbi:hypothetical protein F4774DRAFT_428487 [Daldinia eschscholtzii]|nr:hypothetical protein F4774DRAFT_428487 [Daldinia eschscholtzii]
MEKLSSSVPTEQEILPDQPAMNPPPGVESNLTNPKNFNYGGLTLTSICLTIATMFVLARLYVKAFLIKRMRIEDCNVAFRGHILEYLADLSNLDLIIAGYGIFVGIAYCIYRLINNVGFRIHQWDFRKSNLSEHQFIMHICVNLYSAHLLVTKTAILQEWIHIFVPDGHRSPFYWACQGLTWINIFFYGVAIVVTNLKCIPMKRIWDKSFPGECNLDEGVLEIGSASLNLALDVFILVLPQPIIWRLHMPKIKRMGVSVIFTIGILAIGASCTRVIRTLQYHSGDTTWVSSDLVISSLVEMTCSFLVFCVPVIPRLWNGSCAQDVTTLRTWYNRSTFWAHPRQKLPQPPIGRALRRFRGYWETNRGFSFSRDAKPQESTSQEWSLEQIQGIMCTREIISTVEDASSFTAADRRSGNYPWSDPV